MKPTVSLNYSNHTIFFFTINNIYIYIYMQGVTEIQVTNLF